MRRLALVLIALLSGCNWTGSEECRATPIVDRCKVTVPQPPVADAGARLPSIMIDGDSITAGWDTTGVGHWPVGTLNRGVGGKKACTYTWILYDGWVWWGTAWLHIGVNDINQGASAEDTWACIKTIVDQWHVQWPLMRIYIIPTLPTGTIYANCATSNPKLAALRSLIMASGYGYIDTTAAMTCGETCGGYPALCSTLTIDGIHLNVAGYNAWATALGLP